MIQNIPEEKPLDDQGQILNPPKSFTEQNASQTPLEPSAIEDLQKAQQEAAQNMEGWKRAAADYQNLLKETRRKEEDFLGFANRAVFLELLPILDHLKTMYQHISEEEKKLDWVRGLYQIQRQIDDFLKNHHIEKISTVGECFDPYRHEAVSQQHLQGKNEDEILEEVQAGYTLRGKILYPAKVIIQEAVPSTPHEEGIV